MPRTRDPDDPAVRLSAALAAALAQAPQLRAVAADDPQERRLWRACELCTYLEYRLDGAPDPRDLGDAEITDWAQRGLRDGEAPGDPAAMYSYRPYWVLDGNHRVGTVAVGILDHGWGQPALRLASLYVFTEERGRGHGGQAMDLLETTARALDLGAVRLETDWLWQGAVRFYLRRGYWVRNWKHNLSLVRHFADPRYRIEAGGEAIAFVLADPDGERVLIRARRRHHTLVWDAHPAIGTADWHDTCAGPAPTFALHLAVHGWPLIRGPRDWERRHHWMDTGMPEGLADKITLFEAYAHHQGFRVDTPRIPGLAYPTWEALQAEWSAESSPAG